MQYSLQLQGDKIGVYRKNAIYAKAILGGKRGNNAAAVNFQGHKSFKVGLNACAATAVGAGNG